MKRLFIGAGLACALVTASPITTDAAAAEAVSVENLLRTELQVAEGVEVIVSVIEIGPGFTLPKHYHPGEEFVYVLEGSAVLWQQGKPDVTLGAGEIYRIPLAQVHTAMTGASSAKAIVFRVHQKGEPERIPAE